MKFVWTLTKWLVSWNRDNKRSAGDVNFWGVEQASEGASSLLTPLPLDTIFLHVLGLAQGITDLSQDSAPYQEAATGRDPWAHRAKLEWVFSLACRKWNVLIKRMVSLPREHEMWGRGEAQEMACNLHL